MTKRVNKRIQLENLSFTSIEILIRFMYNIYYNTYFRNIYNNTNLRIGYTLINRYFIISHYFFKISHDEKISLLVFLLIFLT